MMSDKPEPPDRLALLFEYMVKTHQPGQTYTLPEILINFNIISNTQFKWDVNTALNNEGKSPEKIAESYNYASIVKADSQAIKLAGLIEGKNLDPRLDKEQFLDDLENGFEKIPKTDFENIKKELKLERENKLEM